MPFGNEIVGGPLGDKLFSEKYVNFGQGGGSDRRESRTLHLEPHRYLQDTRRGQAVAKLMQNMWGRIAWLLEKEHGTELSSFEKEGQDF